MNDRGAIPWQESFALTVEVCKGLEALHEMKIVHRDLSPANIFVCAEDHAVKIIDLGLATTIGNERSELPSTGMLMGSLHYMSPEVCSGQKATAQSDLYALGCILYELITGHKALSSDNPVGLIYKHCNEYPPPLTQLNMAIPHMVQTIVFRAISKNTSERYESANAMRRDLENALAGDIDSIAPDSVTTIPQRQSVRKIYIGAAAACVSFLLLAGALGISNHNEAVTAASKATAIVRSKQPSFRYSPKSELLREHIIFTMDEGRTDPKTLETQIKQWIHHKPERLANENLLYVAEAYDLLRDYYLYKKDQDSAARVLRVSEDFVNRYQPQTEPQQQAQLLHRLRIYKESALSIPDVPTADKYLALYWKTLKLLPDVVRREEPLNLLLEREIDIAYSLKQWDRACLAANKLLACRPDSTEAITVAHKIARIPDQKASQKYKVILAALRYAQSPSTEKGNPDEIRLLNIVESSVIEGHADIASEGLQVYEKSFRPRNSSLGKIIHLYAKNSSDTCDRIIEILRTAPVRRGGSSQASLNETVITLCAFYPSYQARLRKEPTSEADFESATRVFAAIKTREQEESFRKVSSMYVTSYNVDPIIEQFYTSWCTKLPISARARLCREFASHPQFAMISPLLMNISTKLETSLKPEKSSNLQRSPTERLI